MARKKKANVKVDIPRKVRDRVLSAMALEAMVEIRKRAFPNRARGKSITGKPFKKLTLPYARFKQSKGRPGMANQRLSSDTATGLIVTKKTKSTRHLGWLLNADIVQSLQKRNKFWPMSKKEEKHVLRLGKQILKPHLPKTMKVTKGVIFIDVNPGKK